MASILIKNGTLVDSETGNMRQADLLAEDDRIVEIAPKIEKEAVSVVNAAGCMVTAGLIDHHTHLYPLAKIGTAGESACFGAGVTTAVDAGSTGCDTYE